MKQIRYYMVIAAALMLAACASDELPINEQVTESNESQEESAAVDAGVTLMMDVEEAYAMEAEDNFGLSSSQATRATVSTSGVEMTFTWQKNDEVCFSDGISFAKGRITPTEDGSGFRLIIANPEDGNPFSDLSSTFYAIYPNEAVKVWGGSTVTATIYGEQDYEENNDQTFGGYLASYSSAVSGTKVNFNFRLICSVIDVDLSNFGKTVESVSIMSNDNTSMAGEIHFNCAEGTAMQVTSNDAATAGNYAYSTQSNVVTVNNINQLNPSTVRFYVLPLKHANGVTITVRDTDGNYYTKRSTNSLGNTAATAMTSITNTGNSESLGTVAKPYYKKYNFGAYNSLNVKTGDWMATIPGNIFFNLLSIPGSHDSATMSVSTQNESRSQWFSLMYQLEHGVRALDLRPKATSNSTTVDNLYIYHGSAYTGVKFVNALDTISQFLDNNPSEAIFINLHDESDGDYLTKFQEITQSLLTDYNTAGKIQGMESNLKLSQCRGKMIVFTRDNLYAQGSYHYDPYLACKSGWTDNAEKEGYTLYKNAGEAGGGWGTSVGVTVSYQDIYHAIASNDVKIDLVEGFYTNVIGRSANLTNQNILMMNFCNVAYWGAFQDFPTRKYGLKALITKARAVNSRIQNFFRDPAKGRYGIMWIDYILADTEVDGSNGGAHGNELFRIIRDHNFDYIYTGRTRITHEGNAEDTGVVIDDTEPADGSEVFAPRRR